MNLVGRITATSPTCRIVAVVTSRHGYAIFDLLERQRVQVGDRVYWDERAGVLVNTSWKLRIPAILESHGLEASEVAARIQQA